MKTGLIELIHAEEHPAPSGHPENHSRMQVAIENLLHSDMSSKIEKITVEADKTKSIGRVHAPDYLADMQALCESGGGYLDGDTYVSPGSFKAAYETALAAVEAVKLITKNKYKRIFLAGRPPGHHAESDRGMGFCLINNAAVAAEAALSEFGLNKVAIIDWDVHHGNGTQHIFYDRSDVFYISLHQYPFYPGSGASAEIGTGQGEGYTLNIPMQLGADDNKYLGQFDNLIIPALENYRPELIIISCGFDAHTDDPLAGIELTEKAYGLMTERLVKLSDKYCDGRILSIFEGGYNPNANSRCLNLHIKEMQRE